MKQMRVLLLSTASMAVMASGNAFAQDQDTVEDEIVVTGIRGSLERAVDAKRNAGNIVDGISAEDIGKFPDINVAESLSRVTGVAITRTRGGEGQFVTVRGLGEEFNAVTYNGRLLATENTGREFSFDVIASELISAAEVYKTSIANLGDGGLGGRVNVRAAKPLDRKGFHATGSIGGQYESLAETVGLRASGVLSNSWANDTFGVIASFSYQQRDNRTDIAESTFLVPNAQLDSNGLVNQFLDQDGDGFTDAESDPSGGTILTSDARFNGFAPSVAFQERRRVGGTLAFQYRPNDTIDITIDGLYTNFETPGELFGYSFFPTALANGFDSSNAQVNEFNQVVQHSVVPFTADLVSRRTAGEAETFAIGGNFKFTPNERFTHTLDVSYSDASGQRDNFGSAAGSGQFVVLQFLDSFFTQADSGGVVPDVTFTAANTADINISAAQAAQLNFANPGFLAGLTQNPDGSFTRTVGDQPQVELSALTPGDARVHFARNDIVQVEDEIFTARWDSKFEFDDNASFSAGLDITLRDKGNTAFNNVATQCGDASLVFLCGSGIPIASLLAPDVADNLFTLFDDDFLSESDADFPRAFPTFNIDDVLAAYQNIAGGVFADAFLNPAFDASASSVVSEDVYGGYIQADFSGQIGNIPFTANAGVRFAYTDLTSTGTAGSLDSISSTAIAADGSNQEFDFAAGGDVAIGNDYFDVLPAFNIAFDLTDSIKLRGAFSTTLSRPTLTDLSTFFQITSFNPGGEQVNVSNPNLEAIRANNLDLSLEWYGDGGNFVSIAGFYKDIDDFVTNVVTQQTINIAATQDDGTGNFVALGNQDVTFNVFGPQNGDSAEIYGLEVAAQYITELGFGASGNITLADSNSTSGGVTSQLENISDFSANASIFYEANGFQARASLNHRSDFLRGQTAEGGLNEFVDDFTQVDVSVAYQINDHFTVFGDGINIFNEQFVVLSEFPQSRFLESFEDNGARWVFGVRGSF